MQVLQRRLWLCAVGICALPALGSAATTPKVTFTDTKLKNGLRVIISEDHAAPVFSIAVTYNVGSRDERKGRTGFAHLFEHMMFKGSENVGPGEHFMLVFNNGGNMNGTTNKDRTLYFETLPAEPARPRRCSSKPTGCGRSRSPRRTSTTSATRSRKSAGSASTTSRTARRSKRSTSWPTTTSPTSTR